MNFEINVSHNGQHLFATDKRSLDNTPRLRMVLPLLMKKFPKSEGYEVSVSQLRDGGFILDPEAILADPDFRFPTDYDYL